MILTIHTPTQHQVSRTTGIVACVTSFNLIHTAKLVMETALTVHPIKAIAMCQAHCQAHRQTRMINQRRTRTTPPRRTRATHPARTVN